MLQKLFQFRIVPKLVILVSALLVIAAANRTAAQETFAPLITDNCLMFVHVDLRKINFDRLQVLLTDSVKVHLKDLNFNEKSFNATMREYNKELNNFEKNVRPKIELVMDKLGLRELAVIVDTGLLDMKVPLLVAIPWQNKTTGDLELLSLLLELSDIEYFQTGDFMFFTEPQFKQAIDWTKNIKPSNKAPIYEALKDAGNDEIKIAFSLNEQVRKFIIKIPVDPSLPGMVKNLLVFASNKINWITASASLGRLVSDTKKEIFQITIKTPKESDAVLLRNLLESSIDNGVFLAKVFLESQREEYRVPPLLLEYIAGILRSNMPSVKGDRLVFSASTELNITNVSTLVVFTGIGSGLLLPAVKAARENARKARYSSNIREIILALNCYDSVYGKLPPLYTVDVAGKPLHSWRVLILPFMEQATLHEKIRLNEPWDSEYNKQFHNVLIPQYSEPKITNSNDPNMRCNYVVIKGQPLKPKVETELGDISDGTSKTVSIVVVKEPFCWMDPKADISLEDFVKWTNKKDSVLGTENVGFWNGSVKILPSDMPTEILKAIGTAKGGENVEISQ
ncbi:MAG: DUF1559 domain-containing protein [Planctomycetaceae bacterium]|nr:DUF1559 domain-containing protein [Planctomycetaceae bacterium]